MNKVFNRTKKHIEEEKKKYIFLLSIIVIGIISGCLFILFITKEDKQLVYNNLENIIDTITNNKVNHLRTFINSMSSNLISLIGLYILGISIIGIPVIVFFLFIKGFTIGFSFISLISKYHFKGLFGSVSYLFPHEFIKLVIWILMGYYTINFSIRLFRYLFLKENISLNRYFKNLNKIFIISLITLILASLIETFLSPILIDLWF